MQLKSFFLILGLIISISFSYDRVSDSLTLVAFKESNPTSNIDWDFNTTIDTWTGIKLDANERVYDIQLRNQNVSNIPENINHLSELQNLYLSNNAIDSLPSNFLLLNKLTNLGLNGNNLNNLPVNFGHLIQLMYLNLSDNNLSDLPSSFGNLSNIEALYLNNNNFITLPNSICDLIELVRLDAAGNNLESLPASIGNLDKLWYLDLNSNNLTELPESFTHLDTLTFLHLSRNELTSLPINFGELVDLRTLKLDSNNLETLPVGFNQLIKLEQLDLGFNSLNGLPENFGNLNLIQNLSIKNNNLTELPLDLSNLNLLQTLELNNNSLTNFNLNFSNFIQLRYLNLSDNYLDTLPSNIGDIRNLQYLYINNNSLDSIPASIGEIISLEFLGLRGNELSKLPDDFTKLTKLKTISLDYNLLGSLPVGFDNFENLNYLNLSHNRFMNLPDELFNLTTLKTLDVSNNYLGNLSQAIGNLIELNSLFLDSNSLGSIPSTLSNIPNLNSLKLDLNYLDFYALTSVKDLARTIHLFPQRKHGRIDTLEITSGETASLECIINGDPSTTNYKWYETSDMETIIETGKTFTTNARGRYVCIATNTVFTETDEFIEQHPILLVVNNSIPNVTVNNGLSVDEGNSALILASALSTTDIEQEDSTLIYTVTSQVLNGHLENTNTSGVAITTFTQSDINNSKIQYVNNGEENTTDQFTFKVYDGFDELIDQTFEITINPINETPILIETYPQTMNQDDSLTLNIEMVNANDPEMDELWIIVEEGDNYTFSDSTIIPTAGWSGTLTVPVKVTDGEFITNSLDMTITVHGAVAITKDKSKSKLKKCDFLFAPNPVPPSADEVFFVPPSSIKGEWTISIFDNQGDLIDEQSFNENSGYNYRWDLKNNNGIKVTSGTYVAVIEVEKRDGSKEKITRIVGVKR